MAEKKETPSVNQVCFSLYENGYNYGHFEGLVFSLYVLCTAVQNNAEFPSDNSEEIQDIRDNSEALQAAIVAYMKKKEVLPVC